MTTEEHISPEQFRWLIDNGRRLLAEVGWCSPKEFNIGALAAERLTTWQQSLLQQQVELRWRSRTRFPRPDTWLWTERSLAQASDHWSARYKASLFPINHTVVDACCGAGVDLVALAGRGEVIGIDNDWRMAALSHDNARAHGYRVVVATEEIDGDWLVRGEWLSIDPDRRPSGRRTTEADEFSPTLETVLTIARSARGAIIKLAPSTRIDNERLKWMEDMGQRVWLGNQGECRQQLLLTGQLAEASMRKAVLCEPEAPRDFHGKNNTELKRDITAERPAHERFGLEYMGDPAALIDLSDSPDRFVFDLHNVLHASDLQTSWADRHNLRCLGSAHGYFTADSPLDSPWASAFEVLEVLPWDDRQLRKWLRKRGAGKVEVKTRGLLDRSIHIDANACQKRYSAAEGEPMTLLVTRLANRIRCIVARRLVVP